MVVVVERIIIHPTGSWRREQREQRALWAVQVAAAAAAAFKGRKGRDLFSSAGEILLLLLLLLMYIKTKKGRRRRRRRKKTFLFYFISFYDSSSSRKIKPSKSSRSKFLNGQWIALLLLLPPATHLLFRIKLDKMFCFDFIFIFFFLVVVRVLTPSLMICSRASASEWASEWASERMRLNYLLFKRAPSSFGLDLLLLLCCFRRLVNKVIIF